jgi:hypothetical protein
MVKPLSRTARNPGPGRSKLGINWALRAVPPSTPATQEIVMQLGTVAAIGVILLGLALAWGLYQNHRRNRRMDPVTDQATKALYDRPDPDHTPHGT